jgi:hypothetical protein
LLEIYNAISKTFEIQHGGSTNPWVLTVDTGTFHEEYIVKLFNSKDEQQYHPTNKEFYACALAKEFELSVPDFALIHFEEDFIETLNEKDKQKVAEIGRKYFFGCKLISGNMDYSKALSKKHLESYDIENIFAFDVLIRNVDRREKKPNIFFKEEEYYLIDHEQSLYIDRDFMEYLDEPNRWSFIYQDIKGKHLFYEFLKKNKKNVSFETFMVYLPVISLRRLDSVEQKLKNTGLQTTDYQSIKSYLEDVRLNQSKFLNLLVELIQ